MAETYAHVYAILVTLEVLKQYLEGRQATVLANQFLYYSQGFSKLQVVPDVMAIFDVSPGGRDHYKIWEEGAIPAVVFEMTSAGTQKQEEGFKYALYEQLGVREYWLFDPRAEWVEEQLRGYRLRGDVYEAIADGRSEPLQLRLQVEGQSIAFYREDTGEKLWMPSELAEALQQERQQVERERQRAAQERQRAEQAEDRLAQLQARLQSLGIDLDEQS